MTKINSYNDLRVYQKALDLVEEIYRITKRLPADERYGLVAQMRRAAVSVVSNIAEGYRRQGLGDYIRFLATANGSVAELDAQTEICKRVYSFKGIDLLNTKRLSTEVSKMLTSLINKLAQRR